MSPCPELNHTNLAKGRARLREYGFEDLLHAFINRAHDWHARKQRLAEPDEGAAREIGGKNPKSVSARKAKITPKQAMGMAKNDPAKS